MLSAILDDIALFHSKFALKVNARLGYPYFVWAVIWPERFILEAADRS